MKITLAFALVVAFGCKGKEAAPNEQPSPKAADPVAVAPTVAPAAPAAPATGAPVTDDLETPVKCLGFVNGGAGAYLVTTSRDAATKTLELVGVGTAEDPKLSVDTEQLDAAEAKKEIMMPVAKMNAFLFGREMTPCTEWKKTGDKWSAKIGGTDVTLSTKGAKLTVDIGGVKVENEIQAGADQVTIVTAFSPAEMNNVAVVVNATGTAMSKHLVEWIDISAKK